MIQGPTLNILLIYVHNMHDYMISEFGPFLLCLISRFFFVFFVQQTYTLGSLLSFDSETRIKTDLVCKLTSDKISENKVMSKLRGY